MKNLIDKLTAPDMWRVFGDFPHEEGVGCESGTGREQGGDDGQESFHGFSGYRMAVTSGREAISAIRSATRPGVRASTMSG